MDKKKVLAFAKKQGYDDVRYIGKWREFEAWEPLVKGEGEDDFPCIGLPLLVLVKGETIRMSTEDEAFAQMEEQE
jgi:hypothetical protein